MSLSEAELQHLCALAKLHLDPEESVAFVEKLNSIVAMISTLQEVDTTGVDPLSHPHMHTRAGRSDAISESDRRADFVALAPNARDGLYMVPAVIDSSS